MFIRFDEVSENIFFKLLNLLYSVLSTDNRVLICSLNFLILFTLSLGTAVR